MLDSRQFHGMTQPSNSSRVRFDAYELDLSSGELRKHGIKIKLHDQPFKILAFLIEHPGEVITRERLYERLWPAGTFVDSDMGLNSAIMKLRDALGDSADSPRFVETLPRRGYRLIVPVEHLAPSKTDERTGAPAPILESTSTGSGYITEREASALPPETKLHTETDVKLDPPVTESSRPLSLLRILFATLILLAVLAGAWWYKRLHPAPYTIAVLPLKNLSAESDSDYFSDGLTDEIISNLSIIDGLQVKARASSFAFKDKPQDPRTVGKELGASYLLDGSVLRSGEKLRVDTQLVRTSDGSVLWTGRYNREMKDIFEIQDEISRSIVNELRLKLGSGQRRYNTNIQAYDLYLRARGQLNKALGADSEEIASSIPMFEQVIAKDPNFAPAYAGIANAYAYLSATPRTFSPTVAFTKMSEACRKALDLDPLLAEAYACTGLVDSRIHEWPDAEAAFRRSIELNPNLPRSRVDFATWVLFPTGKQSEAITQVRLANTLDPLSPAALNALNFLLMNMGSYDEIIANAERNLASDPDDYSSQQLMARALVQKGHVTEGAAIFEKLDGGSEAFLGYAYAKLGRRADAEQIIQRHPDFPWIEAIVSGGLGDKDRAVEGLEKMVTASDPRVGIYLSMPELAVLRGDPRTVKIRAELGLNQAQ